MPKLEFKLGIEDSALKAGAASATSAVRRLTAEAKAAGAAGAAMELHMARGADAAQKVFAAMPGRAGAAGRAAEATAAAVRSVGDSARISAVQMARLNAELAAMLPKADALRAQTRRIGPAGTGNVSGFLGASGGTAATAGGPGLGGMVGSLGRATAGTLALTAAFQGLRSAQSAFGRQQSMEMAIAAVGDRAVSTAQQLRELREVAKNPGIGLEESLAGGAKLMGAGMSFERTLAILTEFPNALAAVGGGKEELNGVLTALAQISAKGQVFAEEIAQIAERLPQIRQLMQGAFGTSDTEAIQAMGLSADEFIGGLLEKMRELPRAQAGVRTEWENIGDAIKDNLAFAGRHSEVLVSPFRRALAWMLGVNDATTKAVRSQEALGQSAGRTTAEIRAQAAAASEAAEAAERRAAAEKKQTDARTALLGDTSILGLIRGKALGVGDDPRERAGVFGGLAKDMQASFGTAEQLRERIQKAFSNEKWGDAEFLRRALEQLREFTREAEEARAKLTPRGGVNDLAKEPDLPAHLDPAKAPGRRAARLEFDEKMVLMRAEAEGNRAKIQQLKDEAEIRAETNRLMADGNDLQLAEAQVMARQAVQAQRQANAQANVNGGSTVTRDDPHGDGSKRGRKLARQPRPEIQRHRGRTLTPEEQAAREFLRESKRAARNKQPLPTPDDFVRRHSPNGWEPRIGGRNFEKEKFKEALRREAKEMERDTVLQGQLTMLTKIEGHLSKVEVK